LPIEVRPAVVPDIPAILAVIEEVQALHAESYPTVFKRVAPGSLAPEPLQRALLDEAQLMLVGLVGRIVVGYARAEIQDRPGSPIKHARRQLYLHELGVRRDHQRHGLGSALIQQLHVEAATRHCEEVLVDVMEGNLAAQAFYASAGFVTLRLVMRQTLT
jgi:ribosomal protein S18 acetylase RimI-like enzyme